MQLNATKKYRKKKIRRKDDYIKKRRISRKRKQRGGNRHIPICVYSHSDVFDVLQIQFDYLSKVFKDTSQKLYLFCNKNFEGKTDIEYTTILYDDTLPYHKRIAYCIDKLDVPYFIISHENDILIKYDVLAIHSLVNVMEKNGIDSIDLSVRKELFNNNECKKEIQVNETLYLTNLKDWNYTFNVQPRLWKRSSAVSFYSSVPDKTYKSSENQNVQEYLRNNQKTYSLCSSNMKTSYGLCGLAAGLTLVAPEYMYIHITSNGKYNRRSTYSDMLDPDIQKEQHYIYDTYIKDSLRGILQ